MSYNLRKRIGIFIVACCCLVPTGSQAQFSEVKRHLGETALSGKAKLTFFLMHIYDVSVWVQSKPFSFSKPFALTAEYKRRVSKKHIVDSTIDEISRYHDISKQERLYRQIFSRIFQTVNKGDRLTAIFKPQKPLLFFLNGRPIGKVNNPVIARRFMEIWLHPNVYHSHMRALRGK